MKFEIIKIKEEVAAFAGTIEKIMEGDFADKSLYSPLDSGG